MARVPKHGEDTDVITQQETKQKLKKPKLYKVILHNDDFTTMEFVVMILESIFHHNESDATAIMLHIHTHGMGIAGVFTREIAETKVSETMQAAEEAEYPLLCTMEPDDTKDEEEDEKK
jgi:ATP-dependent Clp protease adaptor protein ClpS